MGPLARRLASRGPSGKAVGEIARREGAADAPLRSNCREGLENEAAILQSVMRNVEAARTKPATAPKADVEIEYPRRPVLASAPAELSLDRLQAAQHGRRLEVTFDQRYGIREVAPRTTDRRIEDNRRSIEQPESLIEPGDGRLDHLRRPSMASVRPVRPDCDRIEVRCAIHARSPR